VAVSVQFVCREYPFTLILSFLPVPTVSTAFRFLRWSRSPQQPERGQTTSVCRSTAV
jgi:hypothetical protein